MALGRTANMALSVARYGVLYPAIAAAASFLVGRATGTRPADVLFFVFLGAVAVTAIGAQYEYQEIRQSHYPDGWVVGSHSPNGWLSDYWIAGLDERWEPSTVAKLALFSLGLAALGGLSVVRWYLST